ncbi:hypothetical protein [Nocardia sp. NPDC051833]|uniref:hypothetical protein n=1 Tax=Nocardia sp. NPDC051833 TaxID=3155674 RepID=UPI00342D976D
MPSADGYTDTVSSALERSMSANTSVRIDAIEKLAPWASQSAVLARLSDMLHDQNVTVMIDATEALARTGGKAGIRAIAAEIGRTPDDPDADYIMYKIEELEALGEVPILDTLRSFDVLAETDDFRAGLAQIERYMGHHNPR